MEGVTALILLDRRDDGSIVPIPIRSSGRNQEYEMHPFSPMNQPPQVLLFIRFYCARERFKVSSNRIKFPYPAWLCLTEGPSQLMVAISIPNANY